MGAGHTPSQTFSVYMDSMELCMAHSDNRENTRSWSEPPMQTHAVQTLATKPSSTEVMEIHAVTVKVEMS